MRALKNLFYLLLFFMFFMNVAGAKKITFLTHFIKPFSYEENGEITGFAVEIVREMMKVLNHPEKIEIFPFIRAFHIVQSTPNYALFIVSKLPEREQTVKWVGPLISSGVYFYKKKETLLKIDSLDDIKKVLAIGVQRGNADHVMLQQKGFTNLHPTNNQMQSVQMLYRGRIDVTPISELVMPSMAKQAKIDVNSIEKTNVKLYDSTLFLVFSKDTPDEIIKKWQKAFDMVKKSGKYKNIYNKYF